MQTTFMTQAFHMKLDFSNNHTMAAAKAHVFKVLSLFIVFSAMCLLPLTVDSVLCIQCKQCVNSM